MLRPTFLSFETAKRALSASQRGLDTVGHNISNVNTIGYTRQRVDQVSISSSGYNAKYVAYRSQFPGQGVNVTGITQIRDTFLDKRYRTEATGAGELTSKVSGLADINAIFDEITTTGNHAKMEEFLTALDKLIAESSSKENATVLRNQAQQIAQLLNKNFSDLQNVKTQQQEELGFAVEEVNTMLEQIAMLNVKIEEDNFYGNPANELNDQRNLLIDQLSEMMDIQVNRTPYKLSNGSYIEKVSIEIKGSADKSTGAGPVMLVDSGEFNKLALAKDKDNNVAEPAQIHIVDGLSGFPVYNPASDLTSDNISSKLLTGSLKGTMDVLNGKGSDAKAGESSFRGIPYYEACLNDYAATLAEKMNSVNALKIYDSTSNTYITIQRPLFQTNDGSDTLTAANMEISDEWVANPMYITAKQENQAFYTDSNGELCFRDDDGNSVPTGVPATALVDGKVDKDGNLLYADGTPVVSIPGNEPLTIDNLQKCFTVEGADSATQKVGMAWPNDYVPGDSANDSLINLKGVLTSKTTSFDNGFTGSFQEYMTNMQSTMAQDQTSNEALLEASMKVLTGLADSRDSVSAVSVDEEGINMMTYQNYYNAAARYMTVLDEALGTIIQSMGVVGR